MSSTTSRLGLYLPGGGSTGQYGADEYADIDKLNGNFKLIDAAAGILRVNGYANLPTSPTPWQPTVTGDGLYVAWNGSAWFFYSDPHFVATTNVRDWISSNGLATTGMSVYVTTVGVSYRWTGNAWTAPALTAGALPAGAVAAMGADGRTSPAVTTGNGAVQADWNTITSPGVYRIFSSNTQTNYPAGAYMFGTLLVIAGGSGTMDSKTQIYFEHSSGRCLYHRTCWNNPVDWTSWMKYTGTAVGLGT